MVVACLLPHAYVYCIYVHTYMCAYLTEATQVNLASRFHCDAGLGGKLQVSTIQGVLYAYASYAVCTYPNRSCTVCI